MLNKSEHRAHTGAHGAQRSDDLLREMAPTSARCTHRCSRSSGHLAVARACDGRSPARSCWPRPDDSGLKSEGVLAGLATARTGSAGRTARARAGFNLYVKAWWPSSTGIAAMILGVRRITFYLKLLAGIACLIRCWIAAFRRKMSTQLTVVAHHCRGRNKDT